MNACYNVAMSTEQFKLNFEPNPSSEIPKSEVKIKKIEEKINKGVPKEKKPPSFYPISEDERIDDQPRYGH